MLTSHHNDLLNDYKMPPMMPQTPEAKASFVADMVEDVKANPSRTRANNLIKFLAEYFESDGIEAHISALSVQEIIKSEQARRFVLTGFNEPDYTELETGGRIAEIDDNAENIPWYTWARKYKHIFQHKEQDDLFMRMNQYPYRERLRRLLNPAEYAKEVNENAF